jgi:UDP-N-acetylglucosamine 4,6-dehydratase/5-epimerase
MYKEKNILITGGTGSFGSKMLEFCLSSGVREVRIFSRDEKKQEELRQKYNDQRIKFIIGDVRERRSLVEVCSDVDFIFHAAALKQVPSCEFFPVQALKTNSLGTENLLDAAIEKQVSSVVVLSTDKAVYPINAMGISKAMMEKIAVSKARSNFNNQTTISVTRYGNVMASRGSVIPLFTKQLINNEEVTITNPHMTRFMMSLNNAVDLVGHAHTNANSGDLFVKKAPATTVLTLLEAIAQLLGKRPKIKVIGPRHGEKLYESLLTAEEARIAEDLGDYYRIPADGRGLNYDLYENIGTVHEQNVPDYNSHNTYRMDLSETVELLTKLDYFQTYLTNG